MTSPFDLRASLLFLARDPLYEKDKPYTLHRSYLTNIPYDNFIAHTVENITIRDLRAVERTFSFDENGIAILELPSRMAYDDFRDPAKIENIYCKEVGEALLQYMSAKSVQIFDFAVRRRHPGWPAKPSHEIEGGGRSQPALQAHLDSTEQSVREIVRTLNQDEADVLMSKRFIYLNIWRPLRGHVPDWPLAVCDAKTVNPSKDLIEMDKIMPDRCENMDLLSPGEGVKINVVGNILAHYSEDQKWYYLSSHKPSELLLFRQVDSSGKSGVPHAAFCNPASPPDPSLTRESVEVRAFVYLD